MVVAPAGAGRTRYSADCPRVPRACYRSVGTPTGRASQNISATPSHSNAGIVWRHRASLTAHPIHCSSLVTRVCWVFLTHIPFSLFLCVSFSLCVFPSKATRAYRMSSEERDADNFTEYWSSKQKRSEKYISLYKYTEESLTRNLIKRLCPIFK